MSLLKLYDVFPLWSRRLELLYFPKIKIRSIHLSEISRLGQQKAVKYHQTCPQNATSSKKIETRWYFPLSSSLCKRDKRKVRWKLTPAHW